MDMFQMTTNCYYSMLNAELHINEWVQDRLVPAEPVFRFISEHLDSDSLYNVLMPLMGIYGQDLLVHLLCVMGVANAMNSFEKWIYPEMRPLWWLRELYASKNAIRPHVALQTYDLSCETSGGFPCAHSMSLTIFLMVVCSKLVESHRLSRHRRLLLHGLFICCTLCMWVSRLYLATEFLHQCLLGTYQAFSTCRHFKRISDYLYLQKRRWILFFVLLLLCLALAVYFAKLRFGYDPHWSVRQAFKWCPEPTYMRHERSPIFLLTRDLGILMGMALSLPLTQLKSDSSKFRLLRLKGIVILVLLNYILRVTTPKQYGRLAFLAYEFTRNTLYSMGLIGFVPKLLNLRAQ